MKPQTTAIRNRIRHEKQFITTSDKLFPETVLPLTTTKLGHSLYKHMESTGSTNEDARSLGNAGAPHGTLVVAETQTQGKGRLDRIWISPPSQGIYATLLIRPELPLDETPLVTLLAAVAATEAIAQTTNLAPTIKWPNDILVNNRKIAGILAEAAVHSDKLEFILIGIGINVNTPAEALPDRPLFPASSLAMESRQKVSRAAVLAAWLDRFDIWLNELQNGNRDSLLAQWLKLACILHRPVVIHGENDALLGTVCGLAPDGALLVTTSNGNTVRILTGDVSFPDSVE